jgi:hypothetical protein
MKQVLMFAALGEAATGLALLTVPSLVGQLLFGQELTGVARAAQHDRYSTSITTRPFSTTVR